MAPMLGVLRRSQCVRQVPQAGKTWPLGGKRRRVAGSAPLYRPGSPPPDRTAFLRRTLSMATAPSPTWERYSRWGQSPSRVVGLVAWMTDHACSVVAALNAKSRPDRGGARFRAAPRRRVAPDRGGARFRGALVSQDSLNRAWQGRLSCNHRLRRIPRRAVRC